MHSNYFREITIVAPASLEGELCCKLREWQVPSYSVIESLNSASRACDAGEIAGKHIRIIALVRSEIAEGVLQGLQREFFSEPSLVYFASDAGIQANSGKQPSLNSAEQHSIEEKWGDYLITL